MGSQGHGGGQHTQGHLHQGHTHHHHQQSVGQQPPPILPPLPPLPLPLALPLTLPPEEPKSQFLTREGAYRLLPLQDYCHSHFSSRCSSRPPYSAPQPLSPPVRLSLIALPSAPAAAPGQAAEGPGSSASPPSPSPPRSPAPPSHRICFNYGKELYVYVYRGLAKGSDLTKPIDKKIYKGTNPTCHDFNTVTCTHDSVSLLIGFSTGQIQILDPIKKENSKLYNEERLIDKTRVTCIRWIPGSGNLFLVAHASGQLYVYNEELGCGTAAPHYQNFKQGEGFAIHTCKTKSTRNPLYRWVIGAEGCCINEFAFSPCGAHLAVVSQDGFLRVFHYDTMELVGHARSYFGGFLCVCWSPDGKYIVVGGEDDLVTVWSFSESRVVARGQGHKSWVSVVAFDPYTSCISEKENNSNSDDENPVRVDPPSVCYRLGSVSQDTQLCLWDITDDVLKAPPKSRASAHLSSGTHPSSPNGVINKSAVKSLKNNKIASKQSDSSASTAGNKLNLDNSNLVTNSKGAAKVQKVNNVVNITVGGASSPPHNDSNPLSVVTQKLAGFSFGERKDNSHRRNFSFTSKSGNSNNSSDGKNNSISNSVALRMKSPFTSGGGSLGSASGAKILCDPLRLIGTPACPRFDDCPVLEPLVCKKVAHERLTALLFREDCLLMACQDGGVYTWARPGLPPPSMDVTESSHLFERDRHFERIDLVD